MGDPLNRVVCHGEWDEGCICTKGQERDRHLGWGCYVFAFLFLFLPFSRLPLSIHVGAGSQLFKCPY